MLVHGFAQTPASWDETIAALPEGLDIQAPELPGHGATALSLGEPTPELARKVILEAVEACAQPPVLWGYSQGARASFDFLIHHQAKLRGAILESGTPGIEDPVMRAERRSRDAAMSGRLERGTIEDFVAAWELVPALGEQPQEVIDKQRPMRLAHDPVALAAAVRGLGQAAYGPLWAKLNEIDLPVLLISGALDEVYSAHAERLARLIPGASHVSVAGAGHAVHVSHPAQAAQLAARFIAQLETAGP